MLTALPILAAFCAFGLTCRFPALACALWVLALETSPDFWLGRLIGGHEAIIAAMKAFGLLLAAVLALRAGLKKDRYNPAFAFFLMFCIGPMYGLYPGLSRTMLRVIDLAQLGEANSLSNRDPVWPYFQQAFATSPWFGWGVGAGAGKMIIPLASPLATELGTNALSSEPRWFMRLVFCAFALHSVTDNTLIATTSNVFFLWVSAVFATAPDPTKPAA